MNHQKNSAIRYQADPQTCESQIWHGIPIDALLASLKKKLPVFQPILGQNPVESARFNGAPVFQCNLFSVANAHNKAFKPLAMLARTFGTPQALAHGFAIVAHRPLRTKRRLTGR